MNESWMVIMKHRTPERFEYERLKLAYSDAIVEELERGGTGAWLKADEAEAALDVFVEQFLDREKAS